jgi:ketosteroid isomerase-like protein
MIETGGRKMKKTLVGVLSIVMALAGALVLTGCASTGAGGAASISATDMAGVKDLANRFVDSINRKDLDGTMACIWNSPDMVWVSFGTVIRGYEGFRGGMTQMFSNNETVRIVVNDISYVPVGNAVMAVGTATIDMQPKNGPSQRVVERWTDLERKINGRWVYVLDHTTLLSQ